MRKRSSAPSQDVVLKLVGLIYDAGGDPSKWSDVLTQLADTTGGTSALLHTDLSYKAANVGASAHLDPDLIKLYQDYYVTLNDITPLRLAALPERGVAVRQFWCSDSEMLRKEYYNDFLALSGCFHSVSGLIFREGASTSNIDVYRPYGMDAFDRAEIELIENLLPHLRRSLQLHRRITDLEQRQKASEAAIDLVPVGVVVQDGRRVVSVNRAALAIVGQNDGLRLAPGGLAAAHPRQNQRLQSLIAEACATSRGEGLSAGGSMWVARPSLLRSYAVLVCPLPPGESIFGGRAGQAAIFITDPEQRVETLDEVTRRAFALTAGEAAVASLLVQGRTIREIADVLRITVATARTHLKHIFAKTDTHRQSELVRLLLMSPASLRLRGTGEHSEPTPARSPLEA